VDLLRLQAEPLSVEEALGHVSDPGAGGNCVFVGTVRDHSDDATGVTHLEYEAYQEAVAGALARVAAEVHAAVPALIGLAIIHRFGTLSLGEASVVVAASAPHRSEAFSAARLAIDRVKRAVPIWKKEHRADGSSEWIACHDALPGGAAEGHTSQAAATPTARVTR
jgi:molybdopterin synthase catalytic subunit